MAITAAHQAAVVLANSFPGATARTGATCHRLSDGLPSVRHVSAPSISVQRGLRLNSGFTDVEPSCSGSSGSCTAATGRLGDLSHLTKSSTCSSSTGLPVARQQSACQVLAAQHDALDHHDNVHVERRRNDVVPDVTRRALLSAGIGLVGISLTSPSDWRATAIAADLNTSDESWEIVPLPVDPAVVLLDVAFVPGEPLRGYLVGTRQTLLETIDGGKTWEPRIIDMTDDEVVNYRFSSISFDGNEGWVVGKPAILLHTEDAGRTWARLPLSARLPGNPVLIKGTGKNSAEMVTDEGAIYVTADKGFYWKAAVEETVSATLNRTVSSGIGGASYYTGTFSNINRSPTGKYVAVSSRGNFFMTWEPGQTFWQPHNRVSSRRIQNIGWRGDGGLWLVTRGGGLYLSQGEGISEDFKETRISSRGFGILDVGFRTAEEGYAAGGSGILLKTTDGGKSWVRDKTADNIAANLYVVRFVDNGNTGFVLGNSGVLLRLAGRDRIPTA